MTNVANYSYSEKNYFYQKRRINQADHEPLQQLVKLVTNEMVFFFLCENRTHR